MASALTMSVRAMFMPLMLMLTMTETRSEAIVGVLPVSANYPSIHLMGSMSRSCLGPPSPHLVIKTNNHGSIESYPLLLTIRLNLQNLRPPIPIPTRQSHDTYRTIQSPPFRGLGPFCPSCRWSRRSDNESRSRDFSFGYRKVDVSLLSLLFRRR